MKKILLLGGTGIIGKPTVFAALKEGYTVTTVSAELDSSLPKEVKQVVGNRNERERFRDTICKLNEHADKWDVVFEIYNLGEKDGRELYECFKDNAEHIFIISTTLVYDRSTPNTAPIKSNHPLAKKGTMGGYAEHKLELELFWRSKTDVNYTILRPYHVLGAGSLLGCVPLHNRDPKLLQRIRKGEALVLCEGGNVEFNFVHPTDIARIVLKAAGNPKTYGKAYNAVNPQKIIARGYFELLGKLLGKEVKIKNKPVPEIWEEENGWALTTLPSVYDVSDMQKDIGFVPTISLETAMRDALLHHPRTQLDVDQIPVHVRMTLPPRPKKIDWLIQGHKSATWPLAGA